MIFENIEMDKYIIQLDLQKRLNDAERKLAEALKKNQRLTEENERNRSQIYAQNVFRQQNEDKN